MARQRKAKAAKEEALRWPAFDPPTFLRAERVAAALLGITVVLGVLLGLACAALVAVTGGQTTLPTLLGVVATAALIPISQMLGLFIGKQEDAPFLSDTPKVRKPALSPMRLAGTMLTYLLVFISVFILLINPPLGDYSAPVIIDHTSPEQELGAAPQLLLEVRENAHLSTVVVVLHPPEGDPSAPQTLQPQTGGLYRLALPLTGPIGTWRYSVIATDEAGNLGKLSDGSLQLYPYTAPIITFLDTTLRVTVDDPVPLALVTYTFDLKEPSSTWYGDDAVTERKLTLVAGSAIISSKGLAPGPHTVSFCAFEPGARAPVCEGPFTFRR